MTAIRELDYLDFELPIADLEKQIEELRHVNSSHVNLADEVKRLEDKVESLTKSIFSKLDAKQISQLARHPTRPYTFDIIDRVFTDFQQLHGDRAFGDDKAIVGGFARFQGQPVMVIGHQKGRDTKENIKRNFGMPRPEGYRKALRLMKLAEKFNVPVVTFVDTPGAYPGIGAEERGQSEAIARNLFEMAKLKVPIITTIMGEGGSGGALAIAVADRVLMMQYAIYSVISPEGCASILWKSADKADKAAEALGITSEKLLNLKLIDRVIKEPLGGAHRDYAAVADEVRSGLIDSMRDLKSLSITQLLDQRHERLLSFGQFSE